MAAFEYEALDGGGKKKRGVITADSARAARKALQGQRLTLLKLEEAAERSYSLSSPFKRQTPKLSESELTLATRQLALLIGASTPVEQALNAVACQAESERVRRTLLAVRESVMEGRRLSEALRKQGRAFSPFYVSVVAAGEAAGALGPVLERLAEYQERSQAMRRKMTAALVYPVVLLAVAISVVIALMAFVVPRVVEQFASIGQDLPALTTGLIAVSNALRDWGWLAALILALGIFTFSRALAQDAFRRRFDASLLSLPLIGRLLRDAAAARFARTFATLTGSGVTVMDALAASRATVSNRVLRDAVDAAAEDVSEGGSLSGAMRKAGVFPPLLVHMAASGETGGDLPAMFGKAADYLENEFESVVQVAMNMLEPAIIVIMGGVVTTIILAIMLPILQLNSSALF